MIRPRTVILGAGGQGRETKRLVEICRFDFVGYVLSDMKYLSERDSSQEVLGDFDWLRDNTHRFDVLALGVGNPKLRVEWALNLNRLVVWTSLIHPSVDKGGVKLGMGIYVAAGVLPTVNVTLENFCLINQGVTLGHESSIGVGSVVNPGANISGGVQVGDGCLIGANACVLEYRKVGNGAIVGAGAVVTKDVEPGQTVIGIPARPI